MSNIDNYYPVRFDLSEHADKTIYSGHAWSFQFSSEQALSGVYLFKIKQNDTREMSAFTLDGAHYTVILSTAQTAKLTAGHADYAVINNGRLVFGGKVNVMGAQWYHE